MDLDTLKQRLTKYPEAILNAKDEGSISTITYQNIVFTNKKYGPLWDLFKKFREDKLEDKDLKYIRFIEKEEIIEPEPVIEINFIKLYELLRSRISDRIKVTARLFHEHTRDVTGIIYGVTPDSFTVFDSNGAQRTIAFADLIKYKFLKKID